MKKQRMKLKFSQRAITKPCLLFNDPEACAGVPASDPVAFRKVLEADMASKLVIPSFSPSKKEPLPIDLLRSHVGVDPRLASSAMLRSLVFSGICLISAPVGEAYLSISIHPFCSSSYGSLNFVRTEL
jgi:hypothetical protein